MPGPATITINATLNSIAGAAADAGARLRISLCGFGRDQPTIAGTAVLAQTEITKLFSGAALAFNVYGNDIISPAGTFYCIRTEDANGNTIAAVDYIFTGAGPIDLAAALPIATSYLTAAVPNGPIPGRRFTLPVPVAAGGQDSLLFYNGLLSTNFSVANKQLALDFDVQPADQIYMQFVTSAFGTGPRFTPLQAFANGQQPGSSFTLPTPPSGAQFAGVFLNGGLQLPTAYDYTPTSLVMHFDIAKEDILSVLYFVGPALPTIGGEIPGGAVPGTNYTLTATPAAGLEWLYNNGQFLRPGIDYTRVGAAITLKNATAPGDEPYAYFAT